MRVSELRNMTREELTALLASLTDEHLKLRMRRGAEEIPNPLRLRTIRRTCAQVRTILREDELGVRSILARGKKEKDARTS